MQLRAFTVLFVNNTDNAQHCNNTPDGESRFESNPCAHMGRSLLHLDWPEAIRVVIRAHAVGRHGELHWSACKNDTQTHTIIVIGSSACNNLSICLWRSTQTRGPSRTRLASASAGGKNGTYAQTLQPGQMFRLRRRRRRSCVSWPDSRRTRFGERIRTIIHGPKCGHLTQHRHMRVVGLMAYIYRIHPIRLGRDTNHSSAAAAAKCVCVLVLGMQMPPPVWGPLRIVRFD